MEESNRGGGSLTTVVTNSNCDKFLCGGSPTTQTYLFKRERKKEKLKPVSNLVWVGLKAMVQRTH